MKKIYQNPEIKVVMLKPMKMIAASNLGLGGSYNGSDEIQSRRSLLWDDDDEDYEQLVNKNRLINQVETKKGLLLVLVSY